MSKTVNTVMMSSSFSMLLMFSCCFGSSFLNEQAPKNINIKNGSSSSNICTSIITSAPSLLCGVRSSPNFHQQPKPHSRVPIPRILAERELEFLRYIYANSGINIDEKLSELEKGEEPIICFRLPARCCVVSGEKNKISVSIKSTGHMIRPLIIDYLAVYGVEGAKMVKYENDLYRFVGGIYSFIPPNMSNYLPPCT